MTEKQPCEKWQAMRDTMYSNENIKKDIEYSVENYSQRTAIIAMAKIAYNEMIENRIAHDRKSRGLK